jgi:hypothetical protein
MMFGKRRAAIGVMKAASLPTRTRQGSELVQILVEDAKQVEALARQGGAAVNDWRLVLMIARSIPQDRVTLERLGATGSSSASAKGDLTKLRAAADRLVLRDYPSLATIVTEQRKA